MTVKELKQELEGIPEDAIVCGYLDGYYEFSSLEYIENASYESGEEDEEGYDIVKQGKIVAL